MINEINNNNGKIEYDTNGTPGIQKDEAVAAINEYLLYQAIDKQTAVTVLNCYFGV
ncbi:MAG: hypothetical protein ACNYWM_13050 [Methanosarcinales archaeon]